MTVLVASLYQRLEATGLPELSVSVKLIVLGCTGSLNVAVTDSSLTADGTSTLVAPDAGLSPITVGADTVGGDTFDAVVKVHVSGLVIGSPAVSLAPLTVAVYVVE